MHPIEFVTAKIAAGKVDDVIEMIHGFCDKLRQSTTRENSHVYSFANNFLISVAGQLRVLKTNQELDEDKLLSVWSELGFFGIERDLLPGNSDD